MKNTAFLFPGQGSQQLGMGSEFFEDSRVKHLFETATEVMGFDIRKLMLEGPKNELNQTENAQPAIFTDSLARYHLLTDEGLSPSCVLGHSLGEFSAVVAAECLPFEKGVRIVKKRGELTSNVEVEGSMVAVVGIDYQKVEEVIEGMEEPITVANYNSPKQLVISGREDHLEKARKKLKKKKAKCIKLDVTGPFHSDYMKEAEDELKSYIEKSNFDDPKFPVLSGVSGELERSGEKLQLLLSRQMTNPVRWVDYVSSLSEFGITNTIEVGPSNTLTKLNKRISPELDGKLFDEVI